VQIGASIMFALGRLAPHRQRGFMLAASAAGVAAAFNTPLAGIVFGIEEMSRSFEERTSTIIIGTVIAAGLTSLALVGNYDYFGSTPATLPFGPGWIATLLCGMLGGLLGGLFSRALIARDDHPADVVRLDRRRRVEADHAARGVPRACRGDHPQARRGHAADPAGDGRRAGPETVALGRLWVQDNPNEGRRQTFPHDLA
jgi:hypothetical protein